MFREGKVWRPTSPGGLLRIGLAAVISAPISKTKSSFIGKLA